MKKLIIAIAAVTVLAVPASSSAVGSARWVTYPTCTATTTTITCTGRAAGVQPQSMGDLGAVEVALHAAVDYTCNSDPPFVWVFSGFPDFLSGDAPENIQVAATFQNGRVFSLQFTPAPNPPGITPNAMCSIAGGYWTRDSNYYNVDVRIGWGQNNPAPTILALQAPIGTVSS
jgi:hypothetical protein